MSSEFRMSGVRQSVGVINDRLSSIFATSPFSSKERRPSGTATVQATESIVPSRADVLPPIPMPPTASAATFTADLDRVEQTGTFAGVYCAASAVYSIPHRLERLVGLKTTATASRHGHGPAGGPGAGEPTFGGGPADAGAPGAGDDSGGRAANWQQSDAVVSMLTAVEVADGVSGSPSRGLASGVSTGSLGSSFGGGDGLRPGSYTGRTSSERRRSRGYQARQRGGQGSGGAGPGVQPRSHFPLSRLDTEWDADSFEALRAADVFAVGCLIGEIALGRPLLTTRDIHGCATPEDLEAVLAPKLTAMPSAIRCLVGKLTRVCPAERPVLEPDCPLLRDTATFNEDVVTAYNFLFKLNSLESPLSKIAHIQEWTHILVQLSTGVGWL